MLSRLSNSYYVTPVMRHRKDIDGLRAIAVLSVVFFHLGFSERLGGGFVGVDVFFVISGYLITSILQAEVGLGRLNLAEFYNRRARRIFPALFLVHLFCLVASSILLFPDAARGVGLDVLRSLAFVSNLSFARASGYFDQSSKVAPLLHTWSLAVEEQFYIALPLILLVLSRVRPWVRFAILATLTLLSFLAAEKALGIDARGAFYFVQYRAWELLLGSLLALGAVPPVRSRALAEAMGTLGLSLILWAIFRIDESTPFPGLWALPPCVGALMLLHSATETETVVARLLSLAPLSWIGTISYSFYLWHWPLIALYNARYPSLTTGARIAIFAGALFASAISYRYVERPFRAKPYRRSARASLLLAGAAMTSLAMLAIGIPAAAARLRPPEEMAGVALKYLKYLADTGPRTCFLHSGFSDTHLFQKDVCLKVIPGRRNVLIVGDSHAAHFVPAFKARYPSYSFLQATISGCQAVHGGAVGSRCRSLLDDVFEQFLPHHHIDTIVLAGRWPRWALPQLQKTIVYLKPIVSRVVVLGPVVEYDQPFPELLAQSIISKNPGLPATHLIAEQRKNDRYFAQQLAASGAGYFSVYDATCPADECTQWAAPGVPMQYDAHHLTLEGAELVLDRLGPSLLP